MSEREEPSAPSLAELRAAIRLDVIEECASLCESMDDCSPRYIAQCIRELAGK